MSSSPTIAVVIPAFNAAAFLREAIRSVSAQTSAVREIVVVDDGSTDDTAQIARDCGVRVLGGPNRGVSHARNAGIRASSSQLVAFLDGDDVWYPERLERQLAVLAARPEILLVASDYAPMVDGIVGSSALREQPAFLSQPKEMLGDDAFVIARGALLAALAVRNFVLPSSMLVDRRIFDTFGEFFRSRDLMGHSENVVIGEDYEWLLRVLRHTDVAFVDRVLVDYRQGPTTGPLPRGRIRYGDVALGKLIAENPDAYVTGAAEAFLHARPSVLRESMISHLRAGQMDLALARAREAATCAPQPAAIAYRVFAAVLTPPWMRAFLGPFLPLALSGASRLRALSKRRA